MKKITLFFIAALSIFYVSAQDIHFSQYYLSPLNLNPAMTGVMNSNIRLVANYRNQWASVLKSNAFSTYSVSYDQRIPVGRYDYFGIGGTFWGDRAGESNFETTTGKLSFSYSKRMGGDRNTSHYLVVGGEVGAAQRSIDFIKLRWPNQHDGNGGWDGTLDSQEEFDRPNFLFADAAAGLMWFSVLDRNNSLFIGGAFHHLNRANQSFNSAEEDLLYSRFTIHAGGEFALSDKVGILPNLILMKQGPSMQINPGASLKFSLGDDRYNSQAFQLGLWWRIAQEAAESTTTVGVLSDAAIVTTRFDYNEFSLGFSYDINISPLKTGSNGNGGFEFALLYRINGRESRNVYCPSF